MSSRDWYEKDYYKILGVPKDAKPDQIKKAFRKIARANHPDQHPNDKKAEQRFKEASEAHDVLSDPAKRREYDQQRSLFGSAGVGGNGGFKFQRSNGSVRPEDLFRNMSDSNFADLLGGLFNQGTQGRRTSTRTPRRGQDVNTEVSIGFTEAVDGTTVKVPLASENACSSCHGTGAKAGTSPRVCPSCEGSGVRDGSDAQILFREPCTQCAGRGLIVDQPCESCHGTGRERGRRTVQARIPAGVDDGQKIRVKGRGTPGENGGAPGDLIVVVRVRPHPVFGRQNNDLTVTVPVTFVEAALGAEIQVPTLGGGSVTLRIPAGTPNGRTFRVRGRGVAKAKSTPGDLLATVEVQVPSTLSTTARQALEAYQRVAGEADPRAGILAGNR